MTDLTDKLDEMLETARQAQNLDLTAYVDSDPTVFAALVQVARAADRRVTEEIQDGWGPGLLGTALANLRQALGAGE